MSYKLLNKRIIYSNFLFLIICIAASSVSSKSSIDVEAKMKNGSIVPDVIPIAPKQALEVIYKGVLDVNFGNELTPRDVKDEPKVKWNAEPKTRYTLCMTDPDAPSRDEPKFREWHHWLVVNIPEDNLSKGEVLSQYIGAGPPLDTGLHRYVFLLYKQKKKTEFIQARLDNKSGYLRPCFKIHEFAMKYDLGDPVAGNYFQAKYDDYVPILYKQLEPA